MLFQERRNYGRGFLNEKTTLSACHRPALTPLKRHLKCILIKVKNEHTNARIGTVLYRENIVEQCEDTPSYILRSNGRHLSANRHLRTYWIIEMATCKCPLPQVISLRRNLQRRLSSFHRPASRACDKVVRLRAGCCAAGRIPRSSGSKLYE
jgi:hypothetical protein